MILGILSIMADVQSVQAWLVPHTRRAGLLRHLAARCVICTTHKRTAPAFVIWFAMLHAVLWTAIQASLRAAEDVHMDTAEAFGWGQTFLFGYGKHPPLSGWIAGLWFMVFPVRDWAAYALAMTTVGISLIVCWNIAVRVVDRKRAMLTVLMLAIYPIFNLKGFKYNADLLQLVTLPLIVLAYLHAFQKRSITSGIWLGLAAVAAMMTKYWAVTIIGATGVAALLHPDRMRFLASPAPWVAVATLIAGLIPHLWWLMQVDFAPLTYAADVYELSSRGHAAELAANYLEHNIGLLLLPLLVALIALRWQPIEQLWRQPLAATLRGAVLWAGNVGADINVAQVRNIRIIQTIVAVVPPIAAVVLAIYIKTDWGIPLFFLVPLVFITIPQLAVQRRALIRIMAIWLAMTLVILVTSPMVARYTVRPTATVGSTFNPASQFAKQLTEAWHQRFRSRWAVVAGTTEAGAPMTFYSSDHPVTLTPGEIWSSRLTSLSEAKRLGFIGICDTADDRMASCESWMAENAAHAEHMNITAHRSFHGKRGPAMQWKVYIVPPAVFTRDK